MSADCDAVVHRVAVVEGVRIAYDPWSPSSRLGEGDLVRESMLGLDARDFARPERRWMDRFVAAAEGDGHEACFYAGGVLVGRIRLIDRSGGGPRARGLAAATGAVKRAFEALVAQDRAGAEGTLVTDASGALLAWEGEGLEVWGQDATVRRLVATARRHPRVRCAVVSRGALLVARPLQGSRLGWLVDVRRAQAILVAPDAVLTPAQRTVAEYAVAGATVDEIARAVDASPETVRSHLKSVYRRLEVANRVELARLLA